MVLSSPAFCNEDLTSSQSIEELRLSSVNPKIKGRSAPVVTSYEGVMVSANNYFRCSPADLRTTIFDCSLKTPNKAAREYSNSTAAVDSPETCMEFLFDDEDIVPEYRVLQKQSNVLAFVVGY